MDTAGLDDSGPLGEKRVRASLRALSGADIVLALVDATTARLPDIPDTPAVVIPVLSKIDIVPSSSLPELCFAIRERFGRDPLSVSSHTSEGIGSLIETLSKSLPEDFQTPPLTRGLVNDSDLVVLVMPQDSEAPKGRLILPQQQVIRELLERGCTAVCCTTDALGPTLNSLASLPAAIITDSRDFPAVRAVAPASVKLTSFSMLLAASKGDMEYFRRSASVLDTLGPLSRVLIVEACSHVPDSEDIGRVKIPALLRARAGASVRIDFARGEDFPVDLSCYDLVIHCGACMLTRTRMLFRLDQAKRQGVPMTNYGVAFAHMNNII